MIVLLFEQPHFPMADAVGALGRGAGVQRQTPFWRLVFYRLFYPQTERTENKEILGIFQGIARSQGVGTDHKNNTLPEVKNAPQEQNQLDFIHGRFSSFITGGMRRKITRSLSHDDDHGAGRCYDDD
ncbi:MAG: hypothetical protein MN733_06605, partial [Nitrososphaera sp.]|nr:hypothetical protein [Nitrososphaera sp.]